MAGERDVREMPRLPLPPDAPLTPDEDLLVESIANALFRTRSAEPDAEAPCR